MKGKLLILSGVLGTLMAVAPLAEAKTPDLGMSAASPQIRVRIGRQRRRRVRVVTTTRITREGRARYRETIRTTYFPNGRVRTEVISLVRIGWRG